MPDREQLFADELPADVRLDVRPYGAWFTVGGDRCGGEYRCDTGVELDREDLVAMLSVLDRATEAGRRE